MRTTIYSEKNWINKQTKNMYYAFHGRTCMVLGHWVYLRISKIDTWSIRHFWKKSNQYIFIILLPFSILFIWGIWRIMIFCSSFMFFLEGVYFFYKTYNFRVFKNNYCIISVSLADITHLHKMITSSSKNSKWKIFSFSY